MDSFFNAFTAKWQSSNKDYGVGVSLFGKTTLAQCLNVSANAFVGRRKMYDYYSANTEYISSSYLGNQVGGDISTRFAASLEVSRDFAPSAGFLATPYIGLDFSHAASERSLWLAADGIYSLATLHSRNCIEIPLGVRLSKSIMLRDCWTLTPSIDGTVVFAPGHRKDSQRNEHHGYSVRTGNGWKVYGLGAGYWGGRIKAGFDVTYRERFNMGVHYSFEGRTNYKDHQIAATIGIAF